MTNQAPIIGIATGEMVDGVRVYRLPPINVTVSRRAELAKIERERAAVDSERGRTRTAAKTKAKRGTPVSWPSRGSNGE